MDLYKSTKLMRSRKQSNFIVLYFSKPSGTYCRVITNIIINPKGFKLISDVVRRNYYDNVKNRDNSNRHYRCHRFSLRTGCQFLPNYARWKNDLFIESPKPFKIVNDLNYNNKITRFFDYPDSYFRDMMLCDEWDSEDENEFVIIKGNNIVDTSLPVKFGPYPHTESSDTKCLITSSPVGLIEENNLSTMIRAEENKLNMSPHTINDIAFTDRSFGAINPHHSKNIVSEKNIDTLCEVDQIVEVAITIIDHQVSVMISLLMNTSTMVDNEQEIIGTDGKFPNDIHNSDSPISTEKRVKFEMKHNNDLINNCLSDVIKEVDNKSKDDVSPLITPGDNLYDVEIKNDYNWIGKQPTDSIIIPDGSILVNDLDSLLLSNQKKRCIKILLEKNYIHLGHFYLCGNAVILERKCGEAYGDWIDFLNKKKFMYYDGFHRSRHDRCGLNDWLVY